MTTFKEMLKRDMENTFFNKNEFAEECMWQGKKIVAIIDDDELLATYSSEFEFLAEGSHLVMIPEGQLDGKPQLFSPVNFNGNLYTVHQVNEQNGMYMVYLNRGKQ